MVKRSDFERNPAKDQLNQKKHGVFFALAQLAFLDHYRVMIWNTVMRKSDIIALGESPVEL